MKNKTFFKRDVDGIYRACFYHTTPNGTQVTLEAVIEERGIKGRGCHRWELRFKKKNLMSSFRTFRTNTYKIFRGK